MDYQLQLWNGKKPEDVAAEVARAIGEAAGGQDGRTAPAVWETVRRRLREFDVCGYMKGCTVGAVPAVAGPVAETGDHRELRIMHLVLPDGLEGFCEELSAAAGRVGDAAVQARMRAEALRALSPYVFRNDICGHPQCRTVATEVKVEA